MYLCYMDESGTPDLPGNTSHFILVGLSIPVWHWKTCDREIAQLKREHSLGDEEIHCAWMLRRYLEQSKIKNFVKLKYDDRRAEVEKLRNAELLRLQRTSAARYRQAKKNYSKTGPYIHLTENERKKFIAKVAETLSQWGFARLFAECVDKIHFDPRRHFPYNIGEMAFDQVVSRFEQYLQVTDTNQQNYGLLIHDNNQTVAKRHTDLMRGFHHRGTRWTTVEHIIETPLFVDSQLTSMVQLADICSYALRRYLENGEQDLFQLVFKRADRKDSAVVGVRHFTDYSCDCHICTSHTK